MKSSSVNTNSVTDRMKPRRIIYLSSWSADSVLSKGSVRPSIENLLVLSPKSVIHYLSIEEAGYNSRRKALWGAIHKPVVKGSNFTIFGKAANYIKVLQSIRSQIKILDPEIIIARGAPAGGMASLASIFTKVKVCVESFEPHGDCMMQAGVWRRYGLKYLVSKMLERLTFKRAKWLAVVSSTYKRDLIEGRVTKATIAYVPCVAAGSSFRFDPEIRLRTRSKLGIEENFVAVYAGKFGGLYQDEEAFDFMRQIKEKEASTHFLLLSTTDHSWIRKQMSKKDFSTLDYTLLEVDHDSVAQYISSADVGLGFHRPTSASHSLSPIKYAEYWACGIPVINYRGVGGEEREIEKLQLGASVGLEGGLELDYAIELAKRAKLSAALREEIIENGSKLRSPCYIKEGYQLLFADVCSGGTFE